MFGEEKETCRACGDVWYSKWYKEGFCHECQNDGTYEDYLMQKHINKIFNIAKNVVLVGAVALCLYFLLK